MNVNTLAPWDDHMFAEMLYEFTYPSNGVGMDFIASVAYEQLPDVIEGWCPEITYLENF